MACLVRYDVYTRAFERAGGRVVEGARLERVYGCKPIEGSNPSLSASSTDFPDPVPKLPLSIQRVCSLLSGSFRRSSPPQPQWATNAEPGTFLPMAEPLVTCQLSLPCGLGRTSPFCAR